jgi:prepilin-type N-terminal cleavage/methylation domain-containing protein
LSEVFPWGGGGETIAGKLSSPPLEYNSSASTAHFPPINSRFPFRLARFDGILFTCARTILTWPNFDTRRKARGYWTFYMARISRKVHRGPPVALSERMEMDNRRSGFSIIELVVVLMVGSVLTSIAITEFNGVSGRFAVKGAQRTLTSMHARARVQAVEYGQTVKLHIDPAGDSVWLSRRGEVLDVMDFGEELNVDIQTSTDANVRVCMNPRGFADTGCNSFSSPVTVSFVLKSDTASVRMFTLGQLVVD